MTGHKYGSSKNWKHVKPWGLKHSGQCQESALDLSHSHHPGENKWVRQRDFYLLLLAQTSFQKWNSKKLVLKLVLEDISCQSKNIRFRILVFLFNVKGYWTHPMIVRWPCRTIDNKKIKLISMYYKRTPKNTQTIHLRVWLLTFHRRKRNFPGARPLPTGLVDPASDFTDPGDQGGRSPHPSTVSGWTSPMLTWTGTPKGNSCGGAQDHHQVSNSEPDTVGPQAPSIPCWALITCTAFTSL